MKKCKLLGVISEDKEFVIVFNKQERSTLYNALKSYDMQIQEDPMLPDNIDINHILEVLKQDKPHG